MCDKIWRIYFVYKISVQIIKTIFNINEQFLEKTALIWKMSAISDCGPKLIDKSRLYRKKHPAGWERVVQHACNLDRFIHNATSSLLITRGWQRRADESRASTNTAEHRRDVRILIGQKTKRQRTAIVQASGTRVARWLTIRQKYWLRNDGLCQRCGPEDTLTKVLAQET